MMLHSKNGRDVEFPALRTGCTLNRFETPLLFEPEVQPESHLKRLSGMENVCKRRCGC